MKSFLEQILKKIGLSSHPRFEESAVGSVPPPLVCKNPEELLKEEQEARAKKWQKITAVLERDAGIRQRKTEILLLCLKHHLRFKDDTEKSEEFRKKTEKRVLDRINSNQKIVDRASRLIDSARSDDFQGGEGWNQILKIDDEMKKKMHDYLLPHTTKYKANGRILRKGKDEKKTEIQQPAQFFFARSLQ